MNSFQIFQSNKKLRKKIQQILSLQKNIDKVLKLAAIVLKNSDDVDRFELKNSAYNNIITSSLSFMSLSQSVSSNKCCWASRYSSLLVF